MNFLAHIYLSGNNPSIMVGNFMADAVKGNQYKNYSNQLQIGILLHRQIDSYTDTHPIVKKSIARLRNKYGLYSGIIVDIFYDHFLAKNWTNYHPQPLNEYVNNFYHILQNHKHQLPEKTANMIPYLISGNWLLSYQTTEGIKNILFQMNIRTQNKAKMDKAINELLEHYDAFENEFKTFFEQLINFANQKQKEICAQYS